MDIVRTGVILNTERYEACVAFYRDLFGLEVLFRREEEGFRLTCFDYGGAYLMVETGGLAQPAGKTAQESPAKLRFNVADIHAALETVQAHGIDAEIVANDWGHTIDIHDPDGNRVGIRDEATFAAADDSAPTAAKR
ncbi:MAG: VOC family protein [Halofilum sp. (in: g-proteobacteria)]|nr:VOC family protein [Halofilum sp. (in: g-proteobacteria)]